MTQADLDLLGDFVSDRITADNFPRLQALLQASAPARRALRGLSLVEETLREIAVEQHFKARPVEKRPATSVSEPSESASRAGWMASPLTRGLVKFVAVPLTIMAVAALVLFLDERQRQAALRPRIPVGAIAQIVAISDVAWQPDAAVHHEADGLQKGASLGVARGLVEIMFACGATIVLEGPATFDITDAGTGTLTRGRLVATLENPTGPFTIHTPSAVVTDRGTQFGVEVDAAGKTEVRVFAGLVELASRAMLGTTDPLPLAAGNAGEVNPAGAVSKIDAPAPKKFAMTVPRPATKQSRPLPFRWDAATAQTIYRDSFAGEGAFAPAFRALRGSEPVARGGGESVTWIAPAEGWQLDPTAGGLSVTAAGAAFLPFRPEPGFVYRLSVQMHVLSGGSGWAAVGFAEQATVQEPTLDHAWMLQRHSTTLQWHRSTRNPNVAFAGPGDQGRLPDDDVLTGPQIRSVVLDTTGPQWRAFFLVGDTLVGDCSIGGRGRSINYVGLSVFADTTATLRNFSLESFRPAID